MTYRKYYWKEARKQIGVALTMIWNGVILDKGHHSGWHLPKKSWFYKKWK